MTYLDDRRAFQVLRAYGLVMPYGLETNRLGLPADIDQAKWEAYNTWNPPPGYTEPDPNASPKPTWDEMVAAEAAWEKWRDLQGDLIWAEDRRNLTITGRAELTEENQITMGGAERYVGEGIDHLTGLLQMVEQSNSAGAQLPHVVMRDGQNRPVSLHLQSEVREVLEAVAARENRIESAHNSLMAEFWRLHDIRQDESLPVGQRYAAGLDALELLENYGESIKPYLAAYDPDALPTDLPTLKALLIERIEAAAMARVKEIKGASTQQGVDLPAACLDIANAVEEVSRKSALGIQNIDDAADNAAAQGACNTAVSAVEAVTPLNVPEWVITLPSGTSTTVTATASHPTGQDIPGRVQITKWQVFDADGDPLSWTPIIRRVNNAAELTADIPAGTTYPVTINLSARNLCGPSVKKVIVPAPE